MLRQAVIDAFNAFTTPLEGDHVKHMYADVLGLITTGCGNLIDPKPAAMVLPWKTQTGDPASPAQVSHEWDNIKAHAAELAHRSLATQATYTSVRLTDGAIDALVLRRLQQNAADIEKQFPYFADFPADAQLAIMSIAWAVGSGFPKKFPTLSAKILAHDWAGACAAADPNDTSANPKRVCDIRVGKPGAPDYNPGVVPRNKANRLCFANAAGVQFAGLDPNVLHWPNDAGDTAPVYK